VPLRRYGVIDYRQLEEIISRTVEEEDANDEDFEEAAANDVSSDEGSADEEPVRAVDNRNYLLEPGAVFDEVDLSLINMQ
jgi:hypothetical protein